MPGICSYISASAFTNYIVIESDFSGLKKVAPTKEKFTLYEDTAGMTEDEVSMMEVAFCRETKEIRAEFSRLLLRLQKSLEKSSQFEHVVNLLINLDDEDWLKKCQSIAAVFQNANKFCSFYNNKAVKLLINELGTDEDKKNYDDYKRKFQKYCLKRVFLFPDGKPSVEVGMLVMKTDDNIEKLPPSEKKELQYEISRVFKGKKVVRLFSEEKQILSTSGGVSEPSALTTSSKTPSESSTPSEASAFTTSNKTPSEASISTMSNETPSEATTLTTPSKTPSEGASPSETSSKTPSKSHASKRNISRNRPLLIPTYQFESKSNTEVS